MSIGYSDPLGDGRCDVAVRLLTGGGLKTSDTVFSNHQPLAETLARGALGNRRGGTAERFDAYAVLPVDSSSISHARNEATIRRSGRLSGVTK